MISGLKGAEGDNTVGKGKNTENIPFMRLLVSHAEKSGFCWAKHPSPTIIRLPMLCSNPKSYWVHDLFSKYKFY